MQQVLAEIGGFSKLIVTVSGFIYYMLAKEEINIILINKFLLIDSLYKNDARLFDFNEENVVSNCDDSQRSNK